MAVSLPLKTGQVPPAAPREHRWSVAVFTSREDLAAAVITIDAVQAALDSHEAVIDVLVNGRPFAEARLVLVDGEYAVQIVNIVPQHAAAA